MEAELWVEVLGWDWLKQHRQLWRQKEEFEAFVSLNAARGTSSKQFLKMCITEVNGIRCCKSVIKCSTWICRAVDRVSLNAAQRSVYELLKKHVPECSTEVGVWALEEMCPWMQHRGQSELIIKKKIRKRWLGFSCCRLFEETKTEINWNTNQTTSTWTKPRRLQPPKYLTKISKSYGKISKYLANVNSHSCPPGTPK